MGLGALAGSALSAFGADRAAKRQVSWERERAKSAHQWEVEDLKKAGLNPILSAGGSGAVTGGIGAPVGDFSGLSDIGGEMADITNARTAKKAQQAQEKLQNAEVEQADAQTANLKIQNKILDAEAKAAEENSATTVLKNERERKYLKSKVGSTINYVGRGFQDVGTAIMTGIGVGGAIKGISSAAKAAKAAKTAGKAKLMTRGQWETEFARHLNHKRHIEMLEKGYKPVQYWGD